MASRVSGSQVDVSSLSRNISILPSARWGGIALSLCSRRSSACGHGTTFGAPRLDLGFTFPLSSAIPMRRGEPAAIASWLASGCGYKRFQQETLPKYVAAR